MARGGRVKRKQVQADDGWTVVTHGLSNLSLGGNMQHVNSTARQTGIVEGLTVDKLMRDFGKLEERWKETACAKEVDQILKARNWSIEQAVCIGIGSFSLDWEHRHRSLWQLVLFVAVFKHLKQRSSSPITLYAQEPIFTSLDTSFLNALDITVLPSEIEKHISEHTFVFSPFVDWNILLPMFLKDNNPDLYVGNQIRDDYTQLSQPDDKRQVLDECNELGRKFLEGREQVNIPDFTLHMHALNGIVVYWRKEKDED